MPTPLNTFSDEYVEPDTPANRALYHGLAANDPVAVRAAFDGGADPNTVVVYPSGGGTGDNPQPVAVPLLSRIDTDPDVSERPQVAAILREFLNWGFDLRQTDSRGGTIVHWVALLTDAALMREIVDRGADINALCQKDFLGGGNVVNLIVFRTLKHDESPMLPILQTVLQQGAEANVYNARGMTPLHWAALIGVPRTVELLLQYGANPALPVRLPEEPRRPASYQNSTPLLLAQRGGNAEVIRLLTAARSDFTPIEAVTTGNAPALLKHLQAGGNPSASDESGTPYLLLAAASGHEDAVWLLLERGANIHITDARGQTALHRAALYGHPDICRLLLERGANVNAVCGPPENRTTPLTYAVQQAEDDIVTVLLEHGASLASPGNRDALQCLLQNVHQMPSSPRGNPNRRARSREEVGIARNRILHLLLAKMDLPRYGGTALCEAASQRLYLIAQYLIDQGADVNSLSCTGKTALIETIEGIHYNRILASSALLQARPDITEDNMERIEAEAEEEDTEALSFLRYMLTKGPDLNTRCAGTTHFNGMTALTIARQLRLTDVAELLEQAGATE